MAAETDSEHAVFFVLAKALGPAELRLDFRQDGLVIATLPLPLEVCPAADPEEQSAGLSTAFVSGGSYAPPPDVELRITVQRWGEDTHLHFVLHSSNLLIPYHFFEIPGKAFRGSPETYHQSLFHALNQLARGKEGRRFAQTLTPERLRRRLVEIGETIADEVIPQELQRAFQALWVSPAMTLQITTDEPWIPWELLRPDLGGEAVETALCERFETTRWLTGCQRQVGQLRIRRLACVEAAEPVSGQGLLSGAVADRHYLTSLSAAGELDLLSVAEASLQEVETLFDRDDIDLWHFAGHGSIEPCTMHLNRGEVLRPSSLDRQRRRQIARRRPLVVLSVCSAAQQELTLTRLGGWVEAWVRRSACGVFLAPLFSVDDTLAHLFNRVFYDSLRRGDTVGRAVWIARQRVKEDSPEDPTWLAYAVYAHPNARVTLPASIER